jgi:O-6-methylguanine DNA methyltransferase
MDSVFAKKVYNIVKKIPKGKVCTYKLIANALDKPGASQAIGRVLATNTHYDVPCHRVVCSDGKISGYFGKSTDGAIYARVLMLRSEGLKIKDGKVVDIEKVLYYPNI